VTRPANPFAAPGAGEQYARGRPYHHPGALARAASISGVSRYGRGLDVACGTGMSTRALAEVSERVVGIDRSPQMLAFAPPSPNGAYALSEAERVPFAGGSFDVVTVCSGVHWFDQPAFFAECRRVLRAPGLVVLYDHYFLGEIPGVPEFAAWTRTLFDRYPLPARAPQVGDPRSTVPDGFEKIGVEYLLSISNLVDAIERGEPAAALRDWVRSTSAPFFEGAASRPVRFLSTVVVLRAH
jgi:ubiquinone/menaquinone biosynthesis C-methylase UbiE